MKPDQERKDAAMTVRQEAHGLIDQMPEESVRALLPVMVKLIPFQIREKQTDKAVLSSKMQAFLNMQEMRKESAQYGFSLKERDGAIAEKYGEFSWGTAD